MDTDALNRRFFVVKEQSQFARKKIFKRNLVQLDASKCNLVQVQPANDVKCLPKVHFQTSEPVFDAPSREGCGAINWMNQVIGRNIPGFISVSRDIGSFVGKGGEQRKGPAIVAWLRQRAGGSFCGSIHTGASS
jgi:hypothetical protein